MKDIFRGKAFWGILVILLLAVFVFPPWIVQPRYGNSYRVWDWIFANLEHENRLWIELDFKMIFAESIIAILVTIGICLIPFSNSSKKKD
jgi:hypothetical protein